MSNVITRATPFVAQQPSPSADPGGNLPARQGKKLTDARAEADYYPDTGCEISPSCFRCPLPRCKFDEPRLILRLRREERDLEIIEAWKWAAATGGSAPPSILDLARRFNVSTRTITRAIQHYNQGNNTLVSGRVEEQARTSGRPHSQPAAINPRTTGDAGGNKGTVASGASPASVQRRTA